MKEQPSDHRVEEAVLRASAAAGTAVTRSRLRAVRESTTHLSRPTDGPTNPPSCRGLRAPTTPPRLRRRCGPRSLDGQTTDGCPRIGVVPATAASLTIGGGRRGCAMALRPRPRRICRKAHRRGPRASAPAPPASRSSRRDEGAAGCDNGSSVDRGVITNGKPSSPRRRGGL